MNIINKKYKRGFSYIFTIVIILVLSLLFTFTLSYMLTISSLNASSDYIESMLNDYITIKSKEIYSMIKNGLISYEMLSEYDILNDGYTIYEHFQNMENGQIVINKMTTVKDLSFSYNLTDKLELSCSYLTIVKYPFSNLNYTFVKDMHITSNYISKII